MSIRSAEQFEKDSTRPSTLTEWHHKSFTLKGVIEAVRNYHLNETNERLYLLRERVKAWQLSNREEFTWRKGYGLLDEIEQEIKERKKAETLKVSKLKNGDILFRYVPHHVLGDPIHGERGFVQWLITAGQGAQTFTQYLAGGGDNFTGSSKNQSWDLIQHVGIYTKDCVREVDGKGLSNNRADLRENCIDLVVRIPGHVAERVADIASRVIAKEGQKAGQGGYPLNDLWNLATDARTGGNFGANVEIKLAEMRQKQIGLGTQDQMDQKVVCSHFVHAVLWAAKNSHVTVKGATTYEFDFIFKISPSHLWRMFRHGEGVWRNLKASFVGVEQDGNLYEMSDPDRFGV